MNVILKLARAASVMVILGFAATNPATGRAAAPLDCTLENWCTAIGLVNYYCGVYEPGPGWKSCWDGNEFPMYCEDGVLIDIAGFGCAALPVTECPLPQECY